MSFSSLYTRHGGTGVAVAPILLIVLGVVFLLNNLGIFRLYQLIKYWPVLLIALGVLMLADRLKTQDAVASKPLNTTSKEAVDESN